jgi:hypothetical protein
LKGNIPEVKTQLENLDKLKSVWNNPRLVRIDELTHDKPDRRIIIKISKGIIYYTDERNYAETKMMIRFAHNHNINLELSKLAWENHLINKKGCQEN